ncbi:hypothetical protein FRC01_008404 [Tulasnella sp. 417]|nr:hypothetical protein FRC01_008404 [Tulasnella sp. 417]
MVMDGDRTAAAAETQASHMGRASGVPGTPDAAAGQDPSSPATAPHTHPSQPPAISEPAQNLPPPPASTSQMPAGPVTCQSQHRVAVKAPPKSTHNMQDSNGNSTSSLDSDSVQDQYSDGGDYAPTASRRQTQSSACDPGPEPAAAARSPTSDPDLSDLDQLSDTLPEQDVEFYPDTNVYGDVEIPTPNEYFNTWHESLSLDT